MVVLDALTLQPESQTNVPPGSIVDVSPDGEWVVTWKKNGEPSEFFALSRESERVRLIAGGQFLGWVASEND